MLLTRKEHILKEDVCIGFSKDTHPLLSLLRTLSSLLSPNTTQPKPNLNLTTTQPKLNLNSTQRKQTQQQSEPTLKGNGTSSQPQSYHNLTLKPTPTKPSTSKVVPVSAF